ncbi:SYVNB ligase, partial [Picathartes gymnocephalus]|nr:SYVNB ligase [Picathartes gymnocephalus]
MLCTALVMAGSLALTTAVVAHAYYLKHQFYPTVVYLTKSSPSMAVLYIQAFVLVFLLGKFMGKVFFGQLRAAEMEHLLERSWYAVTETCLAFTVFRDDFSPRFVALFTLLLFLKCFHWLAEDRVDFMERSPNISWLFHFRIVCELQVLGFSWVWFRNGNVEVLVVSTCSGLVSQDSRRCWWSLGTSAGLCLSKIEPGGSGGPNLSPASPSCPPCPGLIKVLLYMAFMTIMIKVHTFPLFAIRPMYLAMRQFKKAVTDAIMSRRAIRNMNTLYPDATAEELQAMDNVCIICREEMVTGAKRLPCNHIFHTSCLRSWFQRQQTCPTCRMDVLRASLPAQPPPEPPEPAPAPAPAPQPHNCPGGSLGCCHGGVSTRDTPPWEFPPVPPPAGTSRPCHPQHAIPAVPSRRSRAGDDGSRWEPMGAAAFPALSSSLSPPAVPQGILPPFPPGMFPFWPPPAAAGVPPMPVPPAGFAGLTEEELRAMEGHERQHLEARLQCLHNIHTLLDAAMLQINQYLGVLATIG